MDAIQESKFEAFWLANRPHNGCVIKDVMRQAFEFGCNDGVHRYTQEQAAAWLATTEALDKAAPNWSRDGEGRSVAEMATRAISRLAAPGDGEKSWDAIVDMLHNIKPGWYPAGGDQMAVRMAAIQTITALAVAPGGTGPNYEVAQSISESHKQEQDRLRTVLEHLVDLILVSPLTNNYENRSFHESLAWRNAKAEVKSRNLDDEIPF